MAEDRSGKKQSPFKEKYCLVSNMPNGYVSQIMIKSPVLDTAHAKDLDLGNSYVEARVIEWAAVTG